MRCRNIQAALLDRELGLASTAANAALESHLTTCEGCAAVAATERGLTESLGSLREMTPPPVEVSARVLAGLPRFEPAAAEDVSSRQLGWAAVVAVAASAALVAGLWRMFPALGGAARDAWTLAASLGRSLGSIGSAAATLLSSGLETARRLVETLAPIAGAVQGLQPVAIAALACCAAVMAATIVLVVGHDLRTRVLPQKGNPI